MPPRCRRRASAPPRSAPRRRRPRSRASSSAGVLKPDSATTTTSLGQLGQAASKVRCGSTFSVVRSRLLTPITCAPAATALSSSRASWTSTSAGQPEVERLPVQLRQLALGQRRDDQQDRVGARGEGLQYLVGVDDEVLAQDRQAGRRARGPQVGQRAAEAGRLGEDRQRGGARALVGADHIRQLDAFADQPSRGRAPLVLGDQRQARARAAPAGTSADRPASIRRRTAPSSASGGSRCAGAPPPRGSPRESVRAGSRAAPAPGCGRRSAASASAAWPESIARSAAARPRAASGAAAGVDRRAGVHHGQIAARPRLPGQDRLGDLRRSAAGLRRAPTSAGARLSPTLLGGDRVAAQLSVQHLDHPRRRRDAELIDSVLAADQQRVPRAEQRQRPGHGLQIGRDRRHRSAVAWRRRGWSAVQGS